MFNRAVKKVPAWNVFHRHESIVVTGNHVDLFFWKLVLATLCRIVVLKQNYQIPAEIPSVLNWRLYIEVSELLRSLSLH